VPHTPRADEDLSSDPLLKAGALQAAIFKSGTFSCIATDAKGVIQLFNVGAERMLGYTAAEVVNRLTPADISDPQEVVARAAALSTELDTTIAPGFEALVFKASRGIEDIYELSYIRKDKSLMPAILSVTALRDAADTIIGYLLIGTDNTARKRDEEAALNAAALQRAIFNSAKRRSSASTPPMTASSSPAPTALSGAVCGASCSARPFSCCPCLDPSSSWDPSSA
jgi:PAS domain-containing protein